MDFELKNNKMEVSRGFAWCESISETIEHKALIEPSAQPAHHEPVFQLIKHLIVLRVQVKKKIMKH
jgi:hypothetical protein